MQYHIYDYPAPAVRDLGFDERYERLVQDLGFLFDADGPIMQVSTVPVRDEAHLLELFYKAVDDGFEGGIGRLAGPYVQNRCWWVIKIKILQDQEFEVVELVEGNGNYSGYAKRVTCRLPDGRTFGAGIKGGMSKFNADLLGEAGKQQKVVTIEFFGWTDAGIPRQPVAIKWHGEKRTL
ncbi:hypothetical protein CcrBL47_gp238c [Caulobacter phage BL47]|nr:hypothetical protein CcrBL47_gp238c [Caulobacter phage BL47]